MGEFSLMHWLVVGIIVLIFFGPKKLPQLGESLGKAIRGFKQGLNEIDAEVQPVPADLKLKTPEKAQSGTMAAQQAVQNETAGGAPQKQHS